MEAAMEMVARVTSTSNSVKINEHQCKRLAEVYEEIGWQLSSKTIKTSLSVKPLLKVMEAGEVLISQCAGPDWFRSVLVNAENKEAFEELHADLHLWFRTIFSTELRTSKVDHVTNALYDIKAMLKTLENMKNMKKKGKQEQSSLTVALYKVKKRAQLLEGLKREELGIVFCSQELPLLTARLKSQSEVDVVKHLYSVPEPELVLEFWESLSPGPQEVVEVWEPLSLGLPLVPLSPGPQPSIHVGEPQSPRPQPSLPHVVESFSPRPQPSIPVGEPRSARLQPPVHGVERQSPGPQPPVDVRPSSLRPHLPVDVGRRRFLKPQPLVHVPSSLVDVGGLGPQPPVDVGRRQFSKLQPPIDVGRRRSPRPQLPVDVRPLPHPLLEAAEPRPPGPQPPIPKSQSYFRERPSPGPHPLGHVRPLSPGPQPPVDVEEPRSPGKRFRKKFQVPGLEFIPPDLAIPMSEIKVREKVLMGEGATAEVKKAEWLGMPYAVKIFRGQDERLVRREVELHQKLRSIYIVKLNGVAVEENKCMILMELMDFNLYDLILRKRRRSQSRLSKLVFKERSPFRLQDAVGLMLQIAKGMHYLHHVHNILHGDLKPENVLGQHIGRDNYRLKISDFGISEQLCTDMPRVFGKRGTSFYRAPEVLLGTVEYSLEADVYSFAMVSYEILTGRRHFEDELPTAKLITEVINGRRPALPSSLPRVVRDLVQRCWLENQYMRPSFSEIREELERIEMEMVFVPRRWERAWVVLVAVVLGFVAFLWRYRERHKL